MDKRNKGEIYILRVIEIVYSGDEELEGPTFSPQSWGRIEAETLKEDGYLKIDDINNLFVT